MWSYLKLGKNAAHFEKCGTLEKNTAQLENMRHTWKKAAHLEIGCTTLSEKLEKCGTLGKCSTLGKVRHTLKNVAHLEKCATLGKRVYHTCKNTPHFEKCGTLE